MEDVLRFQGIRWDGDGRDSCLPESGEKKKQITSCNEETMDTSIIQTALSQSWIYPFNLLETRGNLCSFFAAG